MIRQGELDRHYNARASVSVDLYAEITARYASLSAEVTSGLPAQRDVIYDSQSGNALDIFGAGESLRPAFIFIHGGYWRAHSKQDSAFMASAMARQGVVTVSLDYTLIPHADLQEIVRQVRRAVAWCYQAGANFGIDPHRLYVGGSSAGGHLAAMTVTGDWHAGFGVPDTVVKGAVPVSGLFDLDPISRCYANEWVKLTPASARELSPVNAIAAPGCRLLIAYADAEPQGFKTQSQHFHAAWTQAGNAAELLEVPHRNHFDVILDLADPESRLFRGALELIEGSIST